MTPYKPSPKPGLSSCRPAPDERRRVATPPPPVRRTFGEPKCSGVDDGSKDRRIWFAGGLLVLLLLLLLFLREWLA